MSRRGSAALGRRRLLYGYLLAVALPALAAAALSSLRDNLNLSSDVLVFLLMTVVAALVGGFGPALLSAGTGAMLLNFFFTDPLHTLSVSDPNNALTLVIFVLVATMVSSAVDLAARRTDEAARAASRTAALAQVDRTRTALLAAVGHDLRTPLAAAKAAVSTLRSVDLDLGPADREELAATADESLDRLAGLIENLLDLSRLQAGALAVELRPVAVEEVLARALDDLAPLSARVVDELPPTLPDIEADPGLLERVLANLVANALRYSPPSHPPRVTAAPDGDTVEIRVVDRGPGIPAADRERVFLPFQRLGDTDNSSGVGLGLALARGLTEAMHGTLEPEDTPQGGLTMVLRMCAVPTAQVAPQPGLRERAGESTP